MKKLLSLLSTITIIGTIITSLTACNKDTENKKYTEEELKELKEKNKISINGSTLEWMELQEKPFNKVDNKWYFVIWRGDVKHDWRIVKFKNNEEQRKKQILEDYKNFRLFLHHEKVLYIIERDVRGIKWNKENFSYFKSVYRWNLDTPEPSLILDNKGNIKVKI